MLVLLDLGTFFFQEIAIDLCEKVLMLRLNASPNSFLNWKLWQIDQVIKTTKTNLS